MKRRAMRADAEPSAHLRPVIRGGGGHRRLTPAPTGPACVPFMVGKRVLGGFFRFSSDNRALINLVEAAYGGLPAQAFPDGTHEFSVELRLPLRSVRLFSGAPPAPRIRTGTHVIRAVIGAGNHAVIEPARHRARVTVSEDMLGHAYHLRYELIEFAVFVLATRGIGLVPLHAACIGRQGRGVLLLGNSGSGKSTLALHCMLAGLDLLAEDAVFVRSVDLLATGVPNYLHMRTGVSDLPNDPAVRDWIVRSPVIRRRSGVEKFEVDLRCAQARLAAAPMELIGAVFVSDQPADGNNRLIEPLGESESVRLLSAGQAYAAGQRGWARFARQLMERGAHRLRRARHPSEAVAALQRLLG